METLSQVLAIAIFIALFAVVSTGKVARHIPALAGGALVLLVVFLLVLKSPAAVVHTLNLGSLAQGSFWYSKSAVESARGVNWQTIIFIAGMMVMVEGLSDAGFFRWVCLRVARLVKCRVTPVFIAFTLLSGFLSMFIASITVMLFLAIITIELSRLLKFDPVPMIITEIFASNVGGAATMAGDPPNIIIGTSFGYSFTDFLVNTGLIAWICMALTIGWFYIMFRKKLQPEYGAGVTAEQIPGTEGVIKSRGEFVMCVTILLVTVALLLTSAETGMSVALIGVIAAAGTLLAGRRHALRFLRQIDWRTLAFFFGLFICVGGLEETGVLKLLADAIGKVAAGSLPVVIIIILWLSTLVSGLVDNIPFAAAMVPVISNLAQTGGYPLPAQAWSLALGTDIGGNATPIGASANVVGIAVAEKAGHPISWGTYCRYALPATVLVIGVCMVYLLLRYA